MAYKKEVVITIILAILLNNVRFIVAPSGGAMGGSVASSSSSSSSSSWRRRPSPSSSRPGVYPICSGYNNGYDYYRSNSGCESFPWKDFLIILGFIIIMLITLYSKLNKYSSVLMLQIGLSNREAGCLQRDLRHIALSTNTSTLDGLNRMIQETTSVILQHQDCWMYGYSSADEYDDDEKMQRRFQQLSNEERAKVDFESFVKVNNVRYQLPVIPKDEIHLQESFIVITIFLKVRGWHNLPAIKDCTSMNEALQNLQSCKIRENDNLLVLWSPQDEGETLSEKQLKEKYFLLKPIHNLSKVQ